ncbi:MULTISPECIES: RNA polymerase sigma factor [Kordiimonas]|jgi:RNA polymerase sigma-70 factor (ECF subfamily)|uniref:RNA polymerase sigma factor n=1 Tax=Kordiimonas TaxID=288021 RepID=UPI002579A7C2|nr:RNA polymerase sigma factor [Kordiimonas sp. UBA4487]
MTYSIAAPDHSLADLSDADLVSRARQGDGAVFELIVRRHNQALFRAARAVLDDERLAQEVLQEAYLSAFTHLQSFQGRASLRTWLTRIVVNQAISLKRRERPMVSLGDEKVIRMQGEKAPGDEMAFLMVDHATPETEAQRHELRKLLESAIQRLPSKYRCVFVLRDVQGLSGAETSFCLEISEVLVRKRLSRAREMLRVDLAQRMLVQASEAFEFAGKRCDSVTAYVVSQLARLGLVVPN